jgi:hypothetical protein
MKPYPLIQTLLLLIGATSVYGQVNILEMSLASFDSLQKCRIRYFSPGKGGRGRLKSEKRVVNGVQAPEILHRYEYNYMNQQ